MATNAAADGDLKAKIARLVQEKGWNQEDFARHAQLNRQTVRDILGDGTRKLRNTTVGACAQGLGLTVTELRDLPLAMLVTRLGRDRASVAGDSAGAAARRLYEDATQPELRKWLDHHPELARKLTSEDIDELLSLQGTGGPLTALGVEHFFDLIERRKKLVHKVQVVAGTEYMGLLEQLVELLYEKIQPYREK